MMRVSLVRSWWLGGLLWLEDVAWYLGLGLFLGSFCGALLAQELTTMNILFIMLGLVLFYVGVFQPIHRYFGWQRYHVWYYEAEDKFQ